MSNEPTHPKKLVEVALPLPEINDASVGILSGDALHKEISP
jgi:hypothetical protein